MVKLVIRALLADYGKFTSDWRLRRESARPARWLRQLRRGRRRYHHYGRLRPHLTAVTSHRSLFIGSSAPPNKKYNQ
jgi:hypothetical protein